MIKIKNAFNAKNNWKTTIILFIFLSLSSILILFLLPMVFETQDGELIKLNLVGKKENTISFAQKEIQNDQTKILWDFDYSYTLFTYQNLWAYFGWFFLILLLTLNHFTLLKKTRGTRRLVSSSIILVASFLLLMITINYMVAYSQWVDAYGRVLKKVLKKSRLGKLKQALMFIFSVFFIIMSSYNIYVEKKVTYKVVKRIIEKQKLIEVNN
ncbi:hypothetical protein [Spiroplasma cantharicola]|uniref:Transmembrane protein n=1 Tax=Spiroplasma cantharicola TaxID=362837 RepID=A0A0M4JVZ0_9MOLU|nr:hypothetical protein [Spiroplasma cantharicola]ALD66017.1 hypothetical protein SCANT_v1c01070 [Spiroplasma cantharicola]